MQTLIKLPRHSLLPKDLLSWTIPLFLLREKQEGNCPRTQGDPRTAGVELHLPNSGISLGAPGSFGMDQSCPGTAAHPSQNILPNESILEAAFSLYSWQQPENQGEFLEYMNPPPGNNSQRTNVFPDTTGKSDTSEGQKGITSGTHFPVGLSFISEHHREQG